jgi:hypothetical protein
LLFCCILAARQRAWQSHPDVRAACAISLNKQLEGEMSLSSSYKVYGLAAALSSIYIISSTIYMKQKIFLYYKSALRAFEEDFATVCLPGAVPGAEWADSLLRPLLIRKLALLPQLRASDLVFDTDPKQLSMQNLFLFHSNS